MGYRGICRSGFSSTRLLAAGASDKWRHALRGAQLAWPANLRLRKLSNSPKQQAFSSYRYGQDVTRSARQPVFCPATCGMVHAPPPGIVLSFKSSAFPPELLPSNFPPFSPSIPPSPPAGGRHVFSHRSPVLPDVLFAPEILLPILCRAIVHFSLCYFAREPGPKIRHFVAESAVSLLTGRSRSD